MIWFVIILCFILSVMRYITCSDQTQNYETSSVLLARFRYTFIVRMLFLIFFFFFVITRLRRIRYYYTTYTPDLCARRTRVVRSRRDFTRK